MFHRVGCTGNVVHGPLNGPWTVDHSSYLMHQRLDLSVDLAQKCDGNFSVSGWTMDQCVDLIVDHLVCVDYRHQF
jgi:hypothetical protein